jgi:peptide/nickel transport system substrate-binding protein
MGTSSGHPERSEGLSVIGSEISSQPASRNRVKTLSTGLIGLALVSAAFGCGRQAAECATCDVVVIAAVGEPSSILPPLVQETVGRDIGDQVFEHLAELAPGKAPIDLAAYRPGLADQWSRVDSLTWRFRLRPGARWHDGQPVTAEDVRFSFDAFSDSVLGAPARSYLAGRVKVVPENATTFLIRFAEPSPEQLYDATYHVRIFPRHIWDSIPRTDWAADTSLARLVGSGPYRVERWKRGEFLILAADWSGSRRPSVRSAIWRFTEDPDAALNLVMSHEADALETVGPVERAKRVTGDPELRLVSYPSAAYGFLGFNLRAQGKRGSHPVLSDRETRRGLALAVDRVVLARSVFGPEAKTPPGPMSQLLWIWSDSMRTLPFDRTRAEQVLTTAGWKKSSDGLRRKDGRELGFDILVPSTSGSRRQLAVTLQEMWRSVGAKVTVTSVDFPIFQQRLERGSFDTYLATWLDEPSARGLADQWTKAGWEVINYGRYANPRFDSLFTRAGAESDVAAARQLYREAVDTLNSDIPAIFLYSPVNRAVVSSRVENLEIDPYSWVSGLRGWKLRPSPGG